MIDMVTQATKLNIKNIKKHDDVFTFALVVNLTLATNCGDNVVEQAN